MGQKKDFKTESEEGTKQSWVYAIISFDKKKGKCYLKKKRGPQQSSVAHRDKKDLVLLQEGEGGK